jgi:tripartite-type tricarboxylate transporter receptor subunit TctC
MNLQTPYRLVVAIAALMCSAIPSLAQSPAPADFFRGKVIRLIIGAAAGGGYDIPGRVVANHFSRHIPGNPKIVVENMPGASSLIMTNYLYNIAPRDGTVIGMVNNSIPLEPRLKVLTRQGGGAQFDLEKMSWIGTPVREPHLLWTWSAAARTVEDLRKRKVTIGSNGVGGDNYTLPFLANRLLGTQAVLVTGYPGTNDTFLAVERGEVQGGGTSLLNLMSNRPDWFRDGRASVIINFGTDRLPEIPQVPTAIELAENEGDKELFRFLAMKFEMARPLALPPGVPSERVRLLQDAFDATMKDPEYLAEAKKIGLDVSPLGGAAIARLVTDIQGTSEAVVQRLRGLLAEADKN